MEVMITRKHGIIGVSIGLTVIGGVVMLSMATGLSKNRSSVQAAISEVQAEVPIQGTLVFSGARHPIDHMLHLWLINDQKILHLGHRGVQPILSRDGKWLFFKGQDGLYRMELGSGNVELLGISKVARIFEYDISPDGNRICFVSIEVDKTKGLKGHNVHIATVDGSELRCITDFPMGDIYGVNHPRWSPDNRRILFTAFDLSEPKGDRNVRLWTIHPNGTDLKRIDGEVSKISVNEPAWSPDGRQIAFVAIPPEDQGGNVRVEQTSGSDLPTFVAPMTERPIAQGDYELYVCSSEGEGVRRLTHNGWNEREPTFAPDGKQICFVSYRHRTVGAAGFGSELYLIGADGTNEHRLTPPQKVEYRRARGGWSEDHHPTWAP